MTLFFFKSSWVLPCRTFDYLGHIVSLGVSCRGDVDLAGGMAGIQVSPEGVFAALVAAFLFVGPLADLASPAASSHAGRLLTSYFLTEEYPRSIRGVLRRYSVLSASKGS